MNIHIRTVYQRLIVNVLTARLGSQQAYWANIGWFNSLCQHMHMLLGKILHVDLFSSADSIKEQCQ